MLLIYMVTLFIFQQGMLLLQVLRCRCTYKNVSQKHVANPPGSSRMTNYSKVQVYNHKCSVVGEVPH